MTRVTLEELRQMAQDANGYIDSIYLHWTAGHYWTLFDDYHINIVKDGIIYISTDDLTEIKSHTWHRNSRAIGIGLTCAYNATPDNLGEEPPTKAQVESLAQVIAVLTEGLGISNHEGYVMTHAEAANIDGYGPETTCERWDLAILFDGDEWMTGGDVLRGKAEWYKANQGSV